jgi:hypothetical protein
MLYLIILNFLGFHKEQFNPLNSLSSISNISKKKIFYILNIISLWKTRFHQIILLFISIKSILYLSYYLKFYLYLTQKLVVFINKHQIWYISLELSILTLSISEKAYVQRTKKIGYDKQISIHEIRNLKRYKIQK